MRYTMLLENNRRWAAERTAADPDFFLRLAREHKPHCLFIGCSDARVPAEVITQVMPGELFVHRNIANQALPTDANLHAALQYAVDVLRVTDVIVCGHEGCGGVRAAMNTPVPPSVDTWVSGVRTVMRLHDHALSRFQRTEDRLMHLVELNVTEQVLNLSRMPVVQAAWAAGTKLQIHGWVYGLHSGLLRDLDVTVDATRRTPHAA